MDLHLGNLKSGEAAPLYLQYDGQHRPQSASITISEDGAVYAEVSGSVGGGTTPDKWHGRTIEIDVPPLANGASVAAVLESAEGSALLNRIHDGHSVEWNGNNNVGTLDDDAQAAVEELEEMLSNVPMDEVVDDLGEYLNHLSLNEAWSGEQTLSEAESMITDNVEAGNGGLARIDGDVEEYLLNMAYELVDDEKAGLSQNHLDALITARKINQDEAEAYAAEHIQTTGLKM